MNKLPLPSQPDILRTGANALSIARGVGGIVLGYQVARTEQPTDSWVPAACAAGLAATDYVDGALARRATAEDGETSHFGAWADQLTDKALVIGTLVGATFANARSGNTGRATAIGLATTVIAARDAYVTAERIRAERSGVVDNTPAQMHGKVKAAAQFAALIGLLSPVMRSRKGAAATIGLLGVSAGLAAHSAFKYHKAYRPSDQAAERAGD